MMDTETAHTINGRDEAMLTAITRNCTCDFPGILCGACKAVADKPAAPRCAYSHCSRTLQDGEWVRNWMGHKICVFCADELGR